jgi:serine carboxypeptidase-like clade 1
MFAHARRHLLPVQGYLVGNGCTDAAFDGNALVPYARGKSLISAELADGAAAACPGQQYWNASTGSACAAALDAVDAALVGLNLYDTLEDCVGRSGSLDALPLPTVGRAWPLRATLPPAGSRVPNWATLGVSVPCMDTSLAAAWVNSPDVRAALHAAPMTRTGKFAMCSNAIEYTHDAGSMLPVHAALLEAGVRALIYSGDHDMCVPHTGSEAWTRALGLPVEAEWRAWRAAPAVGAAMQVAGYTRRYEGGLTYATVKGEAMRVHASCVKQRAS